MIAGAIAVPHSKALAIGLTVFAALLLVIHFLRDLRRSSKVE